jgi:hypothetical protein
MHFEFCHVRLLTKLGGIRPIRRESEGRPKPPYFCSVRLSGSVRNNVVQDELLQFDANPHRGAPVDNDRIDPLHNKQMSFVVRPLQRDGLRRASGKLYFGKSMLDVVFFFIDHDPPPYETAR